MKENTTSKGIWKNNLKLKHDETEFDITFETIDSSNPIRIQNCLYNDLLPYSLNSSPISCLSVDDNVWIATSMLERIADTSESIVVMENESPIGVINGQAIISGILKNPTSEFFDKIKSSKIMNKDFSVLSRNVKLEEVLNQIQKTNRSFAIIQNNKYNFSSVSIREILEIGTMANCDITASLETTRDIATCTIKDNAKEILEKLTQTNCLKIENESSIIDQYSILDKIVNDLDFLNNTKDVLELDASTFKSHTPKLIPEKLSFAEICKVMLEMKHPYVMTEKRIWTLMDVTDVLSKGVLT